MGELAIRVTYGGVGMQTRSLDYFLAVAEHRSFTEAALSMSVSQSAVSQAIKMLENELGVELFTRGGGLTALTTAGRELVPIARRILDDIGVLRSRMRDSMHGENVRLRIACAADLINDVMPEAIKTMITRHPGVTFDVLCSEDVADVAQSVCNGELDIAVLAEVPLDVHGIESEWLAPVELFAIASPGRLPPAGAVSVAELLQARLVLGPRQERIRHLLEDATDPLAVRSAIAVESDHAEAVVLLTAGGTGATVLLEREAARVHDRLGLDKWPFSPRLTVSAALLCTPEPRHRAVADLAQHLRTVHPGRILSRRLDG